MRVNQASTTRLNLAHPNRQIIEDPFFEADIPQTPAPTFLGSEDDFIEELCREFEDLESGRLYMIYGERVA